MLCSDVISWMTGTASCMQTPAAVIAKSCLLTKDGITAVRLCVCEQETASVALHTFFDLISLMLGTGAEHPP